MTPFATTITTILSLGIIVVQIISLILLLALLSGRKNKKDVGNFVSKHALVFSTIVALGGVLGSYIYSSVIGFIPCELCWYARILLFPQALLFIVAWIRSHTYKISSSEVFINSLILSILGILVTGFHYYGQMFNPDALAGCQASGVSCSQLPFVTFGYITIPMMAFSTFVLLALIAALKIKHSR
jgi:disulfide bond formation protein DsbB